MYLTTGHNGNINQEKNWEELENDGVSYTTGDFQTGRYGMREASLTRTEPETQDCSE